MACDQTQPGSLLTRSLTLEGGMMRDPENKVAIIMFLIYFFMLKFNMDIPMQVLKNSVQIFNEINCSCSIQH